VGDDVRGRAPRRKEVALPGLAGVVGSPSGASPPTPSGLSLQVSPAILRVVSAGLAPVHPVGHAGAPF
jgi:hypothetical protein